MKARKLQPGELLISRRSVNDSVTVLALAGELDMATAPALARALNELDWADTVVLDLTDLTFMDSHGLHVLLERAETNHFVVAGPGPNLTRILALTSANRVLRITATIDDALEELSGR